MLKIGVQIAPRFERLGEFLADVRALDAAGADTLWLLGDEEPWLVLAATAAVTGRIRLVLPAPAAMADAPATTARRLATLQRLARQRVVVCAPLAGTLPDEVTALASGIVQVTDAPAARSRAPTQQPPARAPIEVWTPIELSADRPGWRRALHDCEQAGADGVIVRHDHRLLDLLRNPDQDDDRSDLQLAQG
ncbi:MAG TPA: LLM class flavin-dependent oxidoreductase [Planctomycetota bacterium]|nr:LLM class flavin-dependent oxidoreductase [Planctomycetota bacterium]